jgi:hypothetical protein
MQMQLQDQAIYCLPDGTCVRVVQRAEAGAASAWELRHLDTGVLQYTIGTAGCLTGYAMWEQLSGAQRLCPFLTDLTRADLQLTAAPAPQLAAA